MKLHVDEKNRRVIATGNCKGHRIKAIAVCDKRDTFDAEIGKEIATIKYKIKELEMKRKIHLSKVKLLHGYISWCYAVIEDETKIANNLMSKLQKLYEEKENIVY